MGQAVNTTGNNMSPTTARDRPNIAPHVVSDAAGPKPLNSEGGVTMSNDKNGPMIVTRSKAAIKPPSAKDIQKMKEQEFIRKNPTKTA